MAITEHTINDALAEIWKEAHRAWYASGVVNSRRQPCWRAAVGDLICSWSSA